MNLQQTLSLFRQVMAIVGGIAIARGYLDAGTLSQFTDATVQVINVGVTFVGAVMALGSVVWGLWSHTHANAVQNAADAIKAAPTVAKALPVIAALEDAGAQVDTVGMAARPR